MLSIPPECVALTCGTGSQLGRFKGDFCASKGGTFAITPSFRVCDSPTRLMRCFGCRLQWTYYEYYEASRCISTYCIVSLTYSAQAAVLWFCIRVEAACQAQLPGCISDQWDTDARIVYQMRGYRPDILLGPVGAGMSKQLPAPN